MTQCCYSLTKMVSAMLLVLLCAACAGVKVSSVSTQDYVSQRRGDVLTTGKLGGSSREALAVLGMDAAICRKDAKGCLKTLAERDGLDDEHRLSTLAEVWLLTALELEKHTSANEASEPLLNAYLETARHAYAYLFFTRRRPSERAFEDRQTQVRDYYNYAVQQSTTHLFDLYRGRAPQEGEPIQVGKWHIQGRMPDVRLPDGKRLPHDLVPASTLTFRGLRNIYRRDGFGAELVAVTAQTVNSPATFESLYSETPFPAVTGIMSFAGETLQDVLQTTEVDLVGYDPYKQTTVRLAGLEVPMAANFTAGYGLWLARSGFARQALRSVLGRDKGIEAPHVYLMQPYDPNRRIVIMLHGLASSPEAWINVANEVLGDEALRQRYQIWQVYYPTNAPLAHNNAEIRRALRQALRHFDPDGTAPASRDIVLIGHSMGGVLARLLVSSSGNVLWDAIVQRHGVQEPQLQALRAEFDPLLSFEPIEDVTRAIFIAAPHRGTPFAENRLARWLSNLITLPVQVVEKITQLDRYLAGPQAEGRAQTVVRVPNSVDNLSDQDPFVGLAAQMPISPAVQYHTIIANNTPGVPLVESNDGLVPYRSAHLENAQSELIIDFSHSVQETPEAILEIRRILKEHAEPDAALVSPRVPHASGGRDTTPFAPIHASP